MTMKIEITVPEDAVLSDRAGQYLARAMSALGFQRAYEQAAQDAMLRGTGVVRVTEESATLVTAEEYASAEPPTTPYPEPASEPAKRERGKPSPGRARRTKEEIAEDEAAEATSTASEVIANISTGEERIDPTSEADQAQDAADEAAEVEATKTPDLTHDDVRAALKKYLDAYGTPAVMEDGPKVFKMLFGDKAGKVSDIPTDNDSLAKAIAGILEMLEKNPFARTVQL